MTDWIELSIPSLRGKEADYLKECITTNFVSSIGPFIRKFEDLVAQNIGIPKQKTVATSCGTTALQLGLIALGVSHNDLVIIPSYTFIATANSISHIGAKPWLMDVEKNYLTIDPDKLLCELEENTFSENGYTYHKDTKQKISCIVPVHVFGYSPDIDQIKIIAKRFSIPILLDSACGIGSLYKEKKLGELELSGIISFNGNKTITSGAGGIFYSNEELIVKKVRHLSTTAKCSSKYDHDEIGYNYRMSNIQAALGLAQIEQLDKIIDEKRLIFNIYNKELGNLDQYRFISNPPWGKSSHWLNAIILKDFHDFNIEEILMKLRESKIRANYFWKPLHLQKPYEYSLKSDLEGLKNIQDRLLVLPSSPTLTLEDQFKVISVIKSHFNN
tara:strand:+ start:471 stop:1631 length:1161 start_codon:yes stop_codon:yes gene_type:complete